MGLNSFFKLEGLSSFFPGLGLTGFFHFVGLNSFFKLEGLSSFFPGLGLTGFFHSEGLTGFFWAGPPTPPDLGSVVREHARGVIGSKSWCDDARYSGAV